MHFILSIMILFLVRLIKCEGVTPVFKQGNYELANESIVKLVKHVID